MAATAPQNDNVTHALAGAGGGILSMVLTYPLITLSTRAQVESKKAESKFSDAVQRIIAREGIPGLYSGISSALFGISVTNFVYYYWYEWTRSFFEAAAVRAGRATKRLTTLESMIAGAIAGSATVILTNPIWVVNTRVTTYKHDDDDDNDNDSHDTAADNLEAGRHKPRATTTTTTPRRRPSTLAILATLLRREGPQALFAGVLPALVLVINPILQYTLFEQMKNLVESRRKVTPAIAFFLGALGKLFATSVTYPYITVKSQMHVASSSSSGGGGGGGGANKKNKDGMSQTLNRIVRDEGYAGLYKGIGPKVTQSVLTAAFLFAFKDVLFDQIVTLRAGRKVVAK